MTQTNSSAGLFTQLLPLLAQRTILITVSKLEEADRLQVNILPRRLKDSENQALTTPLCVCGTAAELDAELIPQISSFVESQVALASNLAMIEKELADAEKAAREEAKKKQRTIGNGGRRTPEPSNALPAEEERKQATAPEAMKLFDDAPVAREAKPAGLGKGPESTR